MGLFSVSKGWSVAKVGILPDNYRKDFASALPSKHFEPIVIEELDEEEYATEAVDRFSARKANSFEPIVIEELDEEEYATEA
ncbi:MAG: hypothetical protein WCS37_16890, partial [Chloroflexota bacterium]